MKRFLLACLLVAVLFPASLLAQGAYVSIDSTIIVSGWEERSVGVYLKGNEHDLLGAVIWLKYDKTAIILDSVSFEGSIFYPYKSKDVIVDTSELFILI